MPLTTHRIVTEGKKSRCTRCHQTWTGKVRVDCPGVRVYPFEEVPSYLKTITTLERERKYPPDPQSMGWSVPDSQRSLLSLRLR